MKAALRMIQPIGYGRSPVQKALEAFKRQQPALIQCAIYGPCNISDAGLADHMRNRH